MKAFISTVGLLAACAAAAGCASKPVPEARVAATQAAIQSARQVGADRSPAASKQLGSAEEQLNAARGRIKKGDNEEAEMLLTRAESDAALAAALAREARQKAATDAAMQRTRAVSAPMGQPSGR
jgi:hypothetical protein